MSTQEVKNVKDALYFLNEVMDVLNSEEKDTKKIFVKISSMIEKASSLIMRERDKFELKAKFETADKLTIASDALLHLDNYITNLAEAGKITDTQLKMILMFIDKTVTNVKKLL